MQIVQTEENLGASPQSKELTGRFPELVQQFPL
jgi:hypothetical protein